MFDNTKPNIILLGDSTEVYGMPKNLGPYKVAHTLRLAGFEVMVIHHCHVFSISEICRILEHAVSDHTLFVGTNNYFFSKFTSAQENYTDVKLIHTDPGSILPHGQKHNDTIKQLIKRRNPKCAFVLGGPSSRDIDYNKTFDYLVLGYGEMSVVNLAQHLRDSAVKLKKTHRSVHGPIVINDSRAEGYDFTNSIMRYENHDVILPHDIMFLELARGCIFRCAFCSFPLNGKKKLDFIRQLELIRADLIDAYEKFGVTRYVFTDDTVNDMPEKCELIYKMSQSLPFTLEWWGYTRLDLMTAHPQTIDWLFGSGLTATHWGIETLYPRAAKAIGKGGDREKLFRTVRQIKDKYGDTVNLNASFILGLPYEPLDSMQSTMDFLMSDQNPLDTWTCNPLSIRPGGKNAPDNGFFSDLDINYEKYGYRHLNDTDFNRSHNKAEMIWANEHTDRIEVECMTFELLVQKHNAGAGHKMPGWSSFQLAGLGLDVKPLLNKHHQEIDWHLMDSLKLAKAREYKRRIFASIGLTYDDNCNEKFSKFTEWVISDPDIYQTPLMQSVS